MKSIRNSLLVQLGCGLAIVLVLAFVLAFMLVRRGFQGQFDDALLQTSHILAGSTRQELHRNGRLEMELGESPGPAFSRKSPTAYFEIMGESGTLFRSASLGKSRLYQGQSVSLHPTFSDKRLPDGRAGRYLIFRFQPQVEGKDPNRTIQRPWLTIVVAHEREGLDNHIRSTAIALAFVGIVLLLGTTIVVATVVPRGLRPLDRLAEELEAIDAGCLDRRQPIAELPAELVPIATRLNQLFDRLEASFAREKRFSSDVAHELRTPITELRTLAEVALTSPPGDDKTRYFQDALEIAVQMDRMVASLLTLARTESNAAGSIESIESIDVLPLIHRLWLPHARSAELKNISLTLPENSPLAIRCNPALIELVLGNLLHNAIAYTKPGGNVAIAVESTQHGSAIAVRNSDTSMTVADLNLVFDRFWRKDAARTDGNHSGLGLAIAAAAAKEMGATLQVDRPSPHEIRFTVAFASES